MIDDLDRTIAALLAQELPQVRSGQIEISFEQPNREWSGQGGGKTLINCFLYDVRENATLRQHQWQTVHDSRTNGNGPSDTVRMKRTPLRVDCFYLVTVWSGDDEPSQRSIQEHRLLSQCLMVLARFPVLNQRPSEQLLPGQRFVRTEEAKETRREREQNARRQAAQNNTRFPFLVGSLATDEHEIRTRIANHDVMTNPAELWGSLDNNIRAGFSYVVNLPLDPWAGVIHEAGEVGTLLHKSTPPLPAAEGPLLESVDLGQAAYALPTMVGGVVRRTTQQKRKVIQPTADGRERIGEETIQQVEPLAGVSVWLVERGRSAKTDQDGRFVFQRVPAGEYTLEVREHDDGVAIHTERITISADPTKPTRPIVVTIAPPKR